MACRLDINDPRVLALRLHQDGVVTRRQLLDLGATPNDIERWVRRRDLTRVHAGVFVDHTGPLTPRQRQWVAVLAAWPAALADESALPIRQPPLVRLAVVSGRKVVLPPGVGVRRVADLDNQVLWNRAPPRMRVEDALIDVMSRRISEGSVAGAFATLAQVVTVRATTPERILEALRGRRRLAARPLIEAMLTDARDGACSVLERGYLHHVERAHGLPKARRQNRSFSTGQTTFHDVRYLRYGLIVELDGLLGHASATERDDDALRDLYELGSSELLTARVTYGLVFGRACRTAELVAAILRRSGWDGELQRCPRCAAAA